MWCITLNIFILILLFAAPIILCSVSFHFQNEAGSPLELFWVNVRTDELASMGPPIPHLSGQSIDSFEGHKFLVRFSDHVDDVEVAFMKGPINNEEITIVYNDTIGNLSIKTSFISGQKKTIEEENIEDKKLYIDLDMVNKKIASKEANIHHIIPQKFQKYITSIRSLSKNNLEQIVKNATSTCSSNHSNDLISCIASNIMKHIDKLTEYKTQLTNYRDLLSRRLRNYTCSDKNIQTTLPLYSYNISILNSNNNNKIAQQYVVDVLLHKNHSKIWVVNDFLTDEECNVLVQHGKPRLARATVAAPDGTSVVSENRKANQAIYNAFDIKNNPDSDPLWGLYNRIMNITNHHTGLHLQPAGQEPFTIIQYNVDDQYTPHCDGTCDGTTHVATGRVATAVLYCKVADIGGATTFTKSDIFVNPKVNSATFFAYKNKEDQRMDDGYTEHSGCPVLQGEKWITTAWMRDGVTESENWHIYDPSGVRILGA